MAQHLKAIHSIPKTWQECFYTTLYSCSLQSELPGSACTSDGDCSYLANTVCRLKTESTSAAAVKVKVCQCMEGFQPIPGIEQRKSQEL